ncbi:MAG: CHAD domain-containing protein [Bryobacterales bacterium]|nr:CHAD domain-containing protein [Bryobacterales bacterium]
MTLKDYALARIDALEKRVGTEAGKTLDSGHPDAIHDLRVSIRRLTQSLRALEQVAGKQRVKRTRRRLRKWMDAAAEIRNRDIALELVEASGTALDSPLAMRLKKDRDTAHQRLARLLAESRT